MKKAISMLVLVGSTMGVAAAALADAPSRTPPAEAFTACSDSDEGDACTVHFRDLTVKGKCAVYPEDKRLFCLPTDPPPPPPSGAPLPSPPS